MTLNDASDKLLEYFLTNDTFDMEADFKKIVLLTEDENLDKAIVVGALELLEKNTLLTRVSKIDELGDKKEVFLLVKDLRTLTQTVVLPGHLCEEIAAILNQFSQVFEDESLSCKPLAIEPFNIQKLVDLVEILSGESSSGNCSNCGETLDSE